MAIFKLLVFHFIYAHHPILLCKLHTLYSTMDFETIINSDFTDFFSFTLIKLLLKLNLMYLCSGQIYM